MKDDVISMRTLEKDKINDFIDIAKNIEDGYLKPNLERYVASLLFFEPSTRTAFSFDTAMKQLNGKTIIMSGTANTSVKKGESFADTIRMVSAYSNIIIIRHWIEGSARYASEISSLPVINAGDGSNQHPTQALLDLYSIKRTQGKLDNVNIAVVGDLRFGRAVHSLVYGLTHYSPQFYFVSPRHLRISNRIKSNLDEIGVKYEEIEEMSEELISSLDVMYVTRVQKERFVDPEEYEKVKDSYKITSNMLKNVKDNFKVMHPLPRVNEITTDVDDTPYAYYFQQAKNGVYMRQALISKLLGEV